MRITRGWLVALTVCLIATGVREARAEFVDIQAPQQEVEFDGKVVSFRPKVKISFKWPAEAAQAAQGHVRFLFPDGSKLELRALRGKVLRSGVVALALVITVDEREGPSQVGELVSAQVIPIPTEEGCDIWDFTGGSMSGKIDAETRITVRPGDPRFPTPKFGQIARPFTVDSDKQEVQPRELRVPIVFEAAIDAQSDNSAAGTLKLDFGDDGVLCYDIFFAAIKPLGDRLVVEAVGEEQSRDVGIVLKITPIIHIEDTAVWELFDSDGTKLTFVASTVIQPGK